MLTKEFAAKEERLRHYMENKGYDFVILRTRANFAWLTCGGLNHIPLNTEVGMVSLLLGKGRERFILADHIEAPRLGEEVNSELGFAVKEYPWFDGKARRAEIDKVIGSGRVASDVPEVGFDNLPEDFWTVRNPLLPDEMDRYRKVGYDSSCALSEAAHGAGWGLKEFEIESLIASSCLRRQLRPNVILVAAEDRIDRYRHPLPKENPFDNRVMLVLCAERHGLIVSLTRFIYRSAIPRDLDKRHEAVAGIDAAAIAASKPGRTVGEVFKRIMQAYEKAGYKDEWRNHHQGGPAGYMIRDLSANEECDVKIVANQAMAWNPSLPGTTSEDTILVTEKGHEIITRGEDWKYMPFDTEEGTVERPWPLVI